MTSCPPKQRIIRMRILANRVMIRSIIPQRKCFFLPVSQTLLRRPSQFLPSSLQFEKDLTTRILLKTYVARDVENAILFEYYFWIFFIDFISLKTPKDIMGVSTRMKRVSFQLRIQSKRRLPKNCRKFLRRTDMLSEQTEQTVAMSFPILDKSQPVLFSSKQEMSFEISLSKSSCLMATMIFSPRMLKEYPLMDEKTAMKTVRMMNLTVPSVRLPQFLIVSTICPQMRGRKTNPKEDKTKEILAIKKKNLCFQVQANSRRNVLVASLAFCLFSSFFFCYIKLDLVQVSSGLSFNSYSSEESLTNLLQSLSYQRCTSFTLLMCLIRINYLLQMIFF